MKKLLISVFTIILFAGCGTGGDDKPDETMVLSQLYTLEKGDKVVKKDINATAVIKIHHTDKSKESVVELIEGSATIVYKN